MVFLNNLFRHRQNILAAAFGALIFFLMAEIVFAEENPPIDIANLFAWATATPPEWGRGVLFALLGLIGSLVTIFGLIGGAVPGTSGQAKIDADNERLERLSVRQEEIINSIPLDTVAMAEIEKTVNNLRDDLRAERWRQFKIAAVLYAVLGAFFATLLARDILQAIVIGAGWTGFLGTLGLKRDYAERKTLKDAAMEKALSHAKRLERSMKETNETDKLEGKVARPLCLESVNLLERDIRIAQKL